MHFNLPRVISCLKVCGPHSLYIYIYSFSKVFSQEFFGTRSYHIGIILKLNLIHRYDPLSQCGKGSNSNEGFSILLKSPEQEPPLQTESYQGHLISERVFLLFSKGYSQRILNPSRQWPYMISSILYKYFAYNCIISSVLNKYLYSIHNFMVLSNYFHSILIFSLQTDTWFRVVNNNTDQQQICCLMRWI